MKVVVIMPFAKEFDPVFTSIKEAVKAAGPHWQCVRIDNDRAAGDVLTKIKHHISTATICIADVTGFNVNVMWEVGYASALNKPIVAMGQSTTDLPFDIQYVNVLTYQIESQHELTLQLTRALSATHRDLEAHIDRQVIAIAGSHTADRKQARQAFESIATPYFGRGITWYCGVRDPMQQEIVGLLLDQYERIAVINRRDRVIKSTLSERLARHGSRILDPQEQLTIRDRSSALNLLEGFDATFTLYARRADYVFLLWDGQSVKTREFQEWLAANRRPYLLAHV